MTETPEIARERLRLEQERAQIEKAKLFLAVAQYQLQARAYRQANRSWMDRLDDFLFG